MAVSMKIHSTSMILLLAAASALAACGPSNQGGPVGGDGGTDGRMTDGDQVDAFWTDPFVDDDNDGYTEMQGDCDDLDPTVHPFAEEVCDDGKDNDCDGHVDTSEPDEDSDGWGPCRGDCDDTDPNVHPGMNEIPGNSIDDNCDGITDADFDGDGFAEADGDCNDNDPQIHPDADENCFDGIDNNCNNFADANEPDGDGDGYGPCQGDCDDNNNQIHPGAQEVDGDGIDNNCDFLIDEDIDGDGWTAANGDCNDNDAQVHPGAPEICGDGVDNNCNGHVDAAEPDMDGDGLTACAGDCDDSNPGVRPGYVEDPADGMDNDCDGQTDEAREACDCGGGVNQVQSMEICDAATVVNVTTYGNASGQSIIANFGAIAPRTQASHPNVPELTAQNCRFYILCTGPAASTAPEIGTDLGTSDPDPFGDPLPANDLVQLRIQLQVPLNAEGIRFDFIYLSAEYPEWVCTEFNDTFYAIEQSTALNNGNPINISFDSNGMEITVNNNFFENPNNWTQSLVGTGYDVADPGDTCWGDPVLYPGCNMPNPCPPPNNTIGSGTGWLRTTSPVTPGEVMTLTFSIHDEGDHIYDSCVLVDNFHWVTFPVSGPGTVK
jgi:hypothetical protein